MELVWKEIAPERLIYSSDSTVLIEGELPIPEGRSVGSVLCSKASASVSSVHIDTDSAELGGSLTARVFAIDGDGSVFAFDSEAEFTHLLNAPGAAQGMSANVLIGVRTIETRLNGSELSFRAELDLRVNVVSSAPIRVIEGVNGAVDLEVRREVFDNTKCVPIGSRTLRLREELSEAGISEVIAVDGQVLVRDIVCESDGISISGILTVAAVTADSAGNPGSITRQIPFRERLDISNDPKGEICCAAVLNRIEIHTLGEEFSLLAMEAEIAFNVSAVEVNDFTVPVDAFSPSAGFDCLYDELSIVDSDRSVSVQSQLKETVDLPENTADIYLPLFGCANTIITASETSGTEITVSGINEVTVVYKSSGGNTYAYTEDIPFSINVPNDSCCDLPFISGSSAVQITANSEKSMQLSISVQLDLRPYKVKTVKAVTGLAEKELPARTSGLIIAFASREDTVFDIAKRYSVSTESVIRLNPEAAGKLDNGDKLILLI